MQQMYVPGYIQAISKPMSKLYYVAINEQQVGSLNENELTQFIISQKKINTDTLVWVSSMTGRRSTVQIPAIM